MQVLRDAGYKTFDDVWNTTKHAAIDVLDAMGIFVIETALMIDADTFLGWYVPSPSHPLSPPPLSPPPPSSFH